jgi:uncharacterized protein (TIGR02118 family)
VVKLIALYRTPPSPEDFERSYFETHLPLLRSVPGLRTTVVNRFTRVVMGEGLYLMAEMTFDDADSLKAGMRSEAMAAAGKNLETFASGLVTLLYARRSRFPTNLGPVGAHFSAPLRLRKPNMTNSPLPEAGARGIVMLRR